MKHRSALILLMCCICALSGAQPLAGSYTVGGDSPNFLTLQDAANALKHRGVSAPIVINIRPGTYTRDGGAGSLMSLDSIINGSSRVNSIVFQPDVEAGGNPANVIMQSNFNPGTPNGDREIFNLGIDYLTIRNLTFRDADSLDIPAFSLISIEGSFWNPTIEGLKVEGCTFVGTPYFTQGQQFGTDFGVYASGGLMSATVVGNHFSNLRRALSFDVDSAPSGDSLVISDNRFHHLYRGYSGSGNMLGAGIEVVCAHPTIRRNVITDSYGRVGIETVFPLSGSIESNYVSGSFTSEIAARPPSSSADRTVSFSIINNIIMGTGSSGTLQARIDNARILHNTIVHHGEFGSMGLWMTGGRDTVVNNILLSYGGGIGYEQLGSTDLVSDHNLFYSSSTYFGRDGSGQFYFSFDSYRSGSSHDSNSHYSDVSFLTDSLGIHLEECESQKAELDGVPLSAVRTDYYGAARDTIHPFVGAVEGKRLPYDMFADVRKFPLSGAGFGAATGDLDGDARPELAVTDYSNSRVLLYHNGGANRSFTQNQTLFPGFAPTLLRFFDLDHDTNLDLIVAGEANAVKIYWGNGSGSFSGELTVNTTWHPTSIDTGVVSFLGLRTILLTEDNGFLPNRSLLCFLFNGNGRNITEGTVTTPGPLGGSYPDTLNSVLGDFVATDIDGNGSQEVVALSIEFPPQVYIFADTAVGNIPWGHHDSGYFGTGAYLGMTSSISSGDFDGDQRPDILTTGASENKCVLLRNQGNRQFVADTIPATASRGLAVFDYEHDGDLDFVTANRTLDSLGVTVYLNDGTGHFSERRNCYYPFASGNPLCIVPADYDGDGKTDLAITTFDSLFVLYNLGGFNGTTAITEHVPQETPQGFALLQNYPNPFNPSTRIEYALPVESNVSITIYNMLGQEVATLLNAEQFGGHHSIDWNGQSTQGTMVSSGVYFYRLDVTPRDGSPRFTNVRKMLLLK